MKVLFEGEKRILRAKVTRLSGSGVIPLTSAERRILDSTKAVVSGFDWAAATWDEAASEVQTLFDSTVAGLSTTGTYFVQLRGTVNNERYARQITVALRDFGP